MTSATFIGSTVFNDALDKIKRTTSMYNSAVGDLNLAISIEIQRAIENLSMRFENIPAMLECRFDYIEPKVLKASSELAALSDVIKNAG